MRNCLWGFFLLCCISGYAQTISFSPGKVVSISGSAGSVLLYGTTYVQTNSPSNLNLRWRKISETLQSGWNPYLCDNALCYTVVPDSADMMPIDSSQSSTANQMTLYLPPANISGTGQIKLLLYQISNPANNDTITYNINVTGSSSIAEITSFVSLTTFPNPAGEQLTVNFNSPLTKDAVLSIYNSLGEQVETFNAAVGSSSQQLFVGGLAKGFYILRTENEKGEIVQRSFTKL